MAVWNWCVSLTHSVSVSNSPAGSPRGVTHRCTVVLTQLQPIDTKLPNCIQLHSDWPCTVMAVSATASTWALQILWGKHFPPLGRENTDQLGPGAPPAPCLGATSHALLALDLWGICFFSVVIISFIFKFQGTSKKGVSRLDKQMRKFTDIRKKSRSAHAVKISIEGNKMPLWPFTECPMSSAVRQYTHRLFGDLWIF